MAAEVKHPYSNIYRNPRSSARQSTDTFGRAGGTRSPCPSIPSSLRSPNDSPLLHQTDSAREGGECTRDDCFYSSDSDVGSDGEAEELDDFNLRGLPLRSRQGTFAGDSGDNDRTEVLRLAAIQKARSAGSLQTRWDADGQHASPKANSTTSSPRSFNAARLRRESSFLDIHEGNSYRRAGLCSDLTDWAPSAKPSNEKWAGIGNLPDWDTLIAGEATSRPNRNVQEELDWSLQRLLNEQVFEKLVTTPQGRQKFRAYLVQHCPGAEQRLDMYFDLLHYVQTNRAICQASEGFFDLYLAQDSPDFVHLPEGMSDDFYLLLKKQFELKASVGPMQQHLLQSLYKSEFQLFVRAQLIEHNKVRLGSFRDYENTASGLGDCYCLTNPRLPENPIILVSPGFEKVTGYPRRQIIGRNCRFLQGPGTSPESIQRIRRKLKIGESCTELLVNYRVDGTPFICLLTIIPIHDSTGSLMYFIGGQTNVSGQFIGSKGLQFLSEEESACTSNLTPLKDSGVSPTLAQYLQSKGEATDSGSSGSNASSSGASASSSSVHSSESGASGAHDYFDGHKDKSRTAAPLHDKTRGAMSKLFRLSSKRNMFPLPHSPLSPPPHTLTLAGIEGSMRREAHSIEDQIDYYSALYNKLIIFMRAKQEIIFATRDCLEFFELPVDNVEQIYASPLVHADFLSIVQGSSREETRVIQRSILAAVSNGESISIKTGIKQIGTNNKKRVLGSSSTALPSWITAKEKASKYTTLHITPLCDRDDADFAFVAVLS
ncbi:hypothetical protein CBS101457_006937 [Exobasidium rhododendri]|nr:hypothetical protein CBS101457_006937 [Exobasidium rhododendri]